MKYMGGLAWVVGGWVVLVVVLAWVGLGGWWLCCGLVVGGLCCGWVGGWWLWVGGCVVGGCVMGVGLCWWIGCGLVVVVVVLVLADSESTRNDTYNLHTPL